VPIQSQIQIFGDTLLLAVIRLTLVADDGDEIADGVDVRCTNVADTLQSTLFVAAAAFLFLVLLESSAVPELPLIVQCKLFRDDETLPIIVDAAAVDCSSINFLRLWFARE